MQDLKGILARYLLVSSSILSPVPPLAEGVDRELSLLIQKSPLSNLATIFGADVPVPRSSPTKLPRWTP